MPLKPRSPVLGLHPFLRYFSGSPSLTSPAPRKFRPLCGRYTEELPIELFRMNNGRNINVRDYKAQMQKQRTSYDLHVQPDGLVHPYTGDFFERPNGASLRPNGPMLQELVRNFKSRNTFIFRLAQGTKLPSDLTLLHEHSDHYSLQASRPMPLTELNVILTRFCQENGEELSKDEWIARYPFESAI